MKKIIIGIIIVVLIITIGLITYFYINQNQKHEEVKNELFLDLASETNQAGTVIYNSEKQIINDLNYVVYIKDSSLISDNNEENVIVSIYQINDNDELKLKKTKEYTKEEWNEIENSDEYRLAVAKYNSSNENKLKTECFKVKGIFNDYYIYWESLKEILDVLDYDIN